MLILALFGLLAILIFGYAIVKSFFKNSQQDRISNKEYFVSSVAVGVGTFSLIFFIVDQFIFSAAGVGFNSTIAFAYSLLMFLIGIFVLHFDEDFHHMRSFKAFLSRNFSRKVLKEKFKDLISENRTIKILIALMFILIIYKSLFFPIINGDGIGYHAPIIRDLYNDGGLSHDVGSNTIEFTRAYPPTFFILGAWPSILDAEYSEVFIKLMPLLFGFLTLIVVYLLAKNIVFKDSPLLDGKRKALLATFLLMTFPMFANHNVYLNNDTIFTFFGILGIYFLMKYFKENSEVPDRKTNGRYMLLSFAILGFAVNAKHLGVILFASVFIPFVLILFKKELIGIFKDRFGNFGRDIKKIFTSKKFKLLLLSLVVLLIVIAPYFLRNYVYFNDPVYPYLSSTEIFAGKNFHPFLFEPLAEAHDRLNLFYSPAYTAFSITNYARDKDYSMSVLFAVLLLIAIINFRKMNEQQRYLLYFLGIYTIFFVYTILVKYRYFMIGAAILCVVVASKFDDFLKFRVSRLEKKILYWSLGLISLSLVGYLLMLYYSNFFIGLLGPLSARFISGIDIIIMISLLTAIVALLVWVLVNKFVKLNSKTARRAWSAILLVILAIPSLWGLAVINYGLTDEATGQILYSKYLDNKEIYDDNIFRFNPDDSSVLLMNFGKGYEAQLIIRDGTPADTVTLQYGGVSYYSERDYVLIDSSKLASTYDSDLDYSMIVLENLGIEFILYKNPGWEENVFGRNDLYSESIITKNINNEEYFKKVWDNGDYSLYKVLYK
ncbi:MAG TPA: phospholipid carrier-dependent glycosyltransferase [Alphaproteobacteria bacterium]|nr:phospholipid carrier-dependent glycosyltransferase [Alphaproteobacteria bacterium]